MNRRLAPLPLLLIPLVYLLTLAQGPVLGDPTEYTVVAHVLGIAHPPGYAFTTLSGKLLQLLVPFGEISWRMHLLALLATTASAFFAFGTVRRVTGRYGPDNWLSLLAAYLAAFSLAFAPDIWQHSIHANPHIITATFLMANVYFLSRYWASDGTDKVALLAFCLSAGLGVTHHPLTVFGFPAYALLILLVRPTIWREWRTLLAMVGCALLGLAVWLYFPIRSPMEPVLGPSTMNTLNGFLDHVLARGLSESLPYFTLAEQWDRLRVFATLLRLQYPLPLILLAIIGLLTPYWQCRQAGDGWRGAKLSLFYALAFLGFYAFVISLRAQDIMAYLLGPFKLVGLLAGLGLYGLGRWLAGAWPVRWQLARFGLTLFLLAPLWQLVRYSADISLRDYSEGRAYIEAVFDRFAGSGEGAVLLNNWEYMTPLWYSHWVDDRYPDPADVRLEWVSTGTADPWVTAVFNYLGGGPVYLHGYRPEIVAAGFRLRPRDAFYQVVEPGDSSLPPELTPVQEAAGALEFVGYELPQKTVTAGDYVPLTLAFSAPMTTTDYYVPVVTVGEIQYPFTTDSHLITPLWLAGEVIVERFDLSLPLGLPAGTYPVTIGLKNLSTDETTELSYPIGELTVAALGNPPDTADLLANFRQRVGLVSARTRVGTQIAQDSWVGQEPLQASPGDVVHVTLRWESLAKAEESYTVFVHLIDLGNRPLVALDYTPLGGATPTHLWIPKWLPGQQMSDPYRLVIPEGLPAGTYRIEVGLYEMVGLRRLHIADPAGNLVGDRYILGDIVVDPSLTQSR
ncbi:MAG: DUF2723 domain-containing protein [Ardenticatenales bacterium]|nr:DUF2723 domain-containing protein [Ardenticatenales bacterium]